MIDWTRVKAYFCLHLGAFTDEEGVPLDDYLYCFFDVLYNVEQMSWSEIADVTDGYASSTSLRNKAKSLGIQMRSRGGHNYYGRDLYLTEDIYLTNTNTELARKLKVARGSIIRTAKLNGWGMKTAGRPKD